jgi:hypothetical protein
MSKRYSKHNKLYFFFEGTGVVASYWRFIKTKDKTSNTSSRNKENKQDYTYASSH